MTYDLSKFDLGDMLKCSLRLRETAVGAPGTVIGVTELDASEAAPEPAALVATTEKV